MRERSASRRRAHAREHVSRAESDELRPPLIALERCVKM